MTSFPADVDHCRLDTKQHCKVCSKIYQQWKKNSKSILKQPLSVHTSLKLCLPEHIHHMSSVVTLCVSPLFPVPLQLYDCHADLSRSRLYPPLPHSSQSIRCLSFVSRNGFQKGIYDIVGDICCA
jgi:hypothetical protein